MGHVQKRAERKYLARWVDPDGRERAKTFTRKADAERHLAAVEGANLAGAYVNYAVRRPWLSTPANGQPRGPIR
jgi:hypothetical protein